MDGRVSTSPAVARRPRRNGRSCATWREFPNLWTAPMNTESLRRFFDDALGGSEPITAIPLAGGGSCEAFAIDRGAARWVLRRAPRHANVASAHDVLREFTILDAIKDEPVAIARPVTSCDDPSVFGAPFFVMERIDGSAILTHVPEPWATTPESHARALEELIAALVPTHAVDCPASGLGDPAHRG